MTISPLGGRGMIGGALGRGYRRAAAAWTPASIAGCVVWLDFSDANTLYTDDMTTKVSADGDAIYAVADKSGGGFHAKQSAATNRALYKTNIKNSRSAGLFSDDCYLHSYPLGAATDFTAIGVFMPSALTNYVGVFGGTWGRFNLHSDAGGKIYAGVDVSNRIATAAGYLAVNNYYMLTLAKNGTGASNLALYKNGGAATVNTGKTATNPAAGDITIGLTMPNVNPESLFDGYFLEYIVYDNAVSAPNLALVWAYLNTKWAIY